MSLPPSPPPTPSELYEFLSCSTNFASIPYITTRGGGSLNSLNKSTVFMGFEIGPRELPISCRAEVRGFVDIQLRCVCVLEMHLCKQDRYDAASLPAILNKRLIWLILIAFLFVF